MRLFPPQLEIVDHEGFTRDKDIFGRAKLGEGLTHLVTSVDDPLVIALDGPWGSGKTTFLKMWAGELRKLGQPVIYFDAFENDYAEDAFTAIASEIIGLAEERQLSDQPAARQFLNRAKGATKIILRSGLRLGTKLATLGALDAADLEAVASDVAGEASAIVDQYVDEMLTQQQAQRDTIVAFRDGLAALPDLLADKDHHGTDSDAVRLVLIIDELDRCRPDFALQVLERIKHFFSVPRVHFLLGTHVGQLANSVAMAYGPSIDAATYLQKFIHLSVSLVENPDRRDQQTNVKYLEYLKNALQCKRGDADFVHASADLIAYVAQRRNLSLRTIERIMGAVALCAAVTAENSLRPVPLVAGLCIIKTINSNLYARIKMGQGSFNDVANTLALDDESRDRDEQIRTHTRDYWRYCLEDEVEQEIVERYSKGLWRYNIDRSRHELLPILIEHVVERLKPPEPRDNR